MVRKGSTVRVRQRALSNRLLIGTFASAILPFVAAKGPDGNVVETSMETGSYQAALSGRRAAVAERPRRLLSPDLSESPGRGLKRMSKKKMWTNIPGAHTRHLVTASDGRRQIPSTATASSRLLKTSGRVGCGHEELHRPDKALDHPSGIMGRRPTASTREIVPASRRRTSVFTAKRSSPSRRSEAALRRRCDCSVRRRW
jgi:hypothetical protein